MTTQTRNIQWRSFIQAGLTGGIIATVINLILYFVGNALNGGPMRVDTPGQGLQELPFFAVIMLSLIPGLIAGLIYALLKRFISKARIIFLALAAVVFVVFFFGPFSAAQSTVTLWILQVMHIGAALPIIAFLLRADS